MDLSRFRSVFQDISECRTLIIRCLASSNLIALRQAVGFWLSSKEKRAYLNLVWDVFEHIKWIESTGRVTMMGRGLDFCRVESLFRDAAILHWENLVPFVVMIRAPVCFEDLTSWTKQALPALTYGTKMSIIEADSREFQWNTIPIATIKGFAAGFDVSIPITVMTQDVPQYQLGIAALDRPAAMSVFQPTLDKTNRIAVARIDLNSIEYETAKVATYKTIDTFIIVINGPPFMTNVSLILKSPSEGPRCNWPDNPQVLTRVVNYYALSASDSEYGTMMKSNAHFSW